jgi:hypothetical protein
VLTVRCKHTVESSQVDPGPGCEDSAATGVDGDQADNTALSSGAVYVFQ